MATLSPTRNSMTRRLGLGPLPAALTSDAFITRRPCCPTAGSSLQGDLTLAVARARSCMMPLAGAGLAPAVSTRDAGTTRRPYCLAAWSWLQGDLATAALLQVRNSTLLGQTQRQPQRSLPRLQPLPLQRQPQLRQLPQRLHRLRRLRQLRQPRQH